MYSGHCEGLCNLFLREHLQRKKSSLWHCARNIIPLCFSFASEVGDNNYIMLGSVDLVFFIKWEENNELSSDIICSGWSINTSWNTAFLY